MELSRWTVDEQRRRSPSPKAGIVVVTYGGTPDMTSAPVPFTTPMDPYALYAKLAAEQRSSTQRGKRCQRIAITSTATGPATAIEEASIPEARSLGLPEVHADARLNVDGANFHTRSPAPLTSRLLQHPDVNGHCPRLTRAS